MNSDNTNAAAAAATTAKKRPRVNQHCIAVYPSPLIPPLPLLLL